MFDPYRKWLGIPSDQRPPTHYQLLGIAAGESDPDVIEEAAIRQSAHVRAYQVGPHSKECTQVLNELAQARTVLLNPAKKKEYDGQLARKKSANAVAPDPFNLAAPIQTAPPRVTARRKVTTERREPNVAKSGIVLTVPMLLGLGGGVLAALVVTVVVVIVVLRPSAPKVAPPRDPVALAKPNPVVDPKPPEPKKDAKKEAKKDPEIVVVPQPQPPAEEKDKPLPKIPPAVKNDMADAEAIFPNPSKFPPSMMATPDGAGVVHHNSRGAVEIVEAATGKATPVQIPGANFFRFSPDGSLLASVGGFAARPNIVHVVPLDGSRKTVKVQTEGITDLAFSGDGKTFITGTAGGIVRDKAGQPLKDANNKYFLWEKAIVQHWDTATGELLATSSESQGNTISGVGFAPDGSLLSSSNDGVRRWDPKTGQLLGIVPHGLGHSRISADGKMVVGLGGSHPAYFLDAWSIEEKKRVHRVPLEQVYSSLAISHTGQFALTSVRVLGQNMQFDDTSVWDLAAGVRLKQAAINAPQLSLSRDGAIAYFGDTSGRLWRWNTGAKKPGDPGPIVPPKAGGNDGALSMFQVTAPGPSDGFMASPDGNKILYVAGNQKVELIDHKNRQLSDTDLKGGQPFRFSDDGEMILSVEKGLIAHYGRIGTKSYAVIHLKRNPIDAAFSADNAFVAISLAGDPAKSPDGRPLTDARNRPIWNDCRIEVWDTKTPKKVFTCMSMKSPAESVVFADDGSILASGADGVRHWTTTGKLIGHFDPNLTSARISPDGRRVVGTELATPHLTTIQIDPRKIISRHRLEQAGSELTLSRDGRYAMYSIGGPDGKTGETALWDLETGQKLRRTDQPSRIVALSHDGRIAHFQDHEKRVFRWELPIDALKTGDPPKKDPSAAPASNKLDLPPLGVGVNEPVTILRGQAPHVPVLAVSGDGEWMLHSANRVSQLTELKTGETFPLTMTAGSRYCLSDDGKMLASVVGPRVVYCSFDERKLVRELKAPNTVRDAAFSRDGSMLAVGTNGISALAISHSPRTQVSLLPREDCVVEVLDIPSGQSVTCKGHQCAVESVVIADDRTVLSTGRDGLRRWDAKSGKPLSHFEHNLFPSRISADGKFVVGLDVKTMQYTSWDIAKGKIAHRGKAMTQLPTSLDIAVSPDGRYLLCSSRVPVKNGETIGLIDMQAGGQVSVREGVGQYLALLPEGLAYYTDVGGHQIMRWQFDLK